MERRPTCRKQFSSDDKQICLPGWEDSLGVIRRDWKIIPKLMGGKVIRGVLDYQSETACSAKIEHSSLSVLVQINV